MLTDFRLKVFKTVADRLSFTKAAAELLISQPAVTKQINELERLLGKPLFLRHGNRISLTDDGVRLLEYANRILALYGELRDAFVEEQGAFSGEIRLGATCCPACWRNSASSIPMFALRFLTGIPNRSNGRSPTVSWISA